MQTIEETCGKCAHYRANDRHIRASGAGRCSCWSVKGKNGNYAEVKNHQPACEHFMPKYISINSME